MRSYGQKAWNFEGLNRLGMGFRSFRHVFWRNVFQHNAAE
jgi:hypothetical protein